MSYSNIFFDFQLFGDEGAAVGGDISTGDAATTAENASTEGVATGGDAEQSATAAGNDQTPAEDTWDSLINGKYKKEYGKAVQTAINKRFKSQNAQYNLLDPMVRGLAKKYGISPNADGSIPLEALNKAYLDDNEQYEKEAFDRGMAVDDLKQMKALERENAQLKQRQQQEENNRYWSAMEEQARQLKSEFPSLDFATEMENPEFGHQLAFFKGSDPEHAVEKAYKAVHMDEIMSGAMQYAVQRTNEKISKAIQSGSRRPVENGMQGTSAGKSSSIDPSKLTAEQRAEYIRRAQRGERITFR